MSLVPAKCTQCGANIEVDNTKDAWICPYCHTPFIVEKAINNYTTNNYTNNYTNVVKNTTINANTVVMSDVDDYVIKAGVLTEYRGESTDVEIPVGVTKIKKGVFAHSMISSVWIPKTVTVIGDGAFCDCRNLKAVYIDDLESWCKITFGDDSGTDNEINAGWDERTANPLSCAQQFYVNNELTDEIIIPDTVTGIKAHAFSGFSGLKSIIIPNSVKTIEGSAFANCSSLESISIPFIGKTVDSKYDHFWHLYGLPKSLKTVTITGGKIKEGDFKDYHGVENIIITAPITTIGEEAFRECGMKTITLPATLKSIEKDAFSLCNNLKAVYYTGDIASWCKIKFESGPLYYAHNLYINNELVTDLVIPDTVDHINDYAFKGWNGKSLSIPGNATIGSYVFAECKCLEKIDAPGLRYLSLYYDLEDAPVIKNRLANKQCLYCGEKLPLIGKKCKACGHLNK